MASDYCAILCDHNANNNEVIVWTLLSADRTRNRVSAELFAPICCIYICPTVPNGKGQKSGVEGIGVGDGGILRIIIASVRQSETVCSATLISLLTVTVLIAAMAH